jgi:hypothetical protein
MSAACSERVVSTTGEPAATTTPSSTPTARVKSIRRVCPTASATPGRVTGWNPAAATSIV